MDSQNGVASARCALGFYAHCMVPTGEGVFETLRVVESRPQLLARHLERLAGAASRLGLESPDPTGVERDIHRHLDARPLALGRMRITWAQAPDGPALSIDSAPIVAPKPSIDLTIGDWRVDEASPLAGLKTTSYADYSVAMRGAQAEGFDDALLGDTRGDLCETTTANVFYVLGGVIRTPTLSSGCLPGIARGLVLELCDVSELDEPLSVLAGASEVFVTSSLREVQPVARIDDVAYPAMGPITADVVAAWRRSSDSAA